MSRINQIYTRCFVDGYNMSGQTRQIGEVGVTCEAPMDAALSDAVMNVTALGRASIKFGPLNAFLSPTAAATKGMYELANSGRGQRNVIAAWAAAAEPTLGDPCFAWMMEQMTFTQAASAALIAVNAAFPNASYAGELNYSNPWARLLHGSTAETTVNAAAGLDDNGATASASGGLLHWQILSSNGTVTVKMQDATASNLDASFADVTGATSGSQDASTTPKSGFVQLATNAAIRKYLRPQIVFGTATTVTYIMAFSRALP